MKIYMQLHMFLLKLSNFYYIRIYFYNLTLFKLDNNKLIDNIYDTYIIWSNFI